MTVTSSPDMSGLDFCPLNEEWVCELHGIPECRAASCVSLPWGDVYDPGLDDFRWWAMEWFGRIIGPYDRGEVADMPDEAFDVYCPGQWAVYQVLTLLAGLPLIAGGVS